MDDHQIIRQHALAHLLILLVSAHRPPSTPPTKAVLLYVFRLSSREEGLSRRVLSIPQKRHAGYTPHAPPEIHCLKPEKILDTPLTPPILTTASSPMHRLSPTGPGLLPRTGATPFVLTTFFFLCCAASYPSSQAASPMSLDTLALSEW